MLGCPQEGTDRKGAVQFNDLYVSNYVGLPRLRHANTMPTHENAHHKGAAAFGGGPLVVWIEMCWHGVGMPQPG